MFCNHCGHKNSLGSNFCSSCGKPFTDTTENPATITFQIDSIDDGPATDSISDVADAHAVLLVTRGPNAGSSFVVTGAKLTIGRHPDSDIFLDDVTVSRHHVEITEVATGGYHIRDTGSLNGTYVNRERVAEAFLTPGDELQIGRFRLRYLVDGLDADGVKR